MGVSPAWNLRENKQFRHAIVSSLFDMTDTLGSFLNQVQKIRVTLLLPNQNNALGM